MSQDSRFLLRMMQNYYQILGVRQSASHGEIKKKYHQLVKKYHPDSKQYQRLGLNEYEARKKFEVVVEAWEVLGDEERRKEYDNTLNGNQREPSFSNETRYQQAPSGTASARTQHSPVINFSDYGSFDKYVAEVLSTGDTTQAKETRELRISFREAFYGTRKTVEISGKTANIPIPRGVKDGYSFRLSNPLASAIRFVVRVSTHHYYEFEGYDLLIKIPVTAEENRRGVRLEIPTPDGIKLLQMRAGNAGKIHKIKKHGWIHGGARTNLLVRPIVLASSPEKIQRQRELVKKVTL